MLNSSRPLGRHINPLIGVTREDTLDHAVNVITYLEITSSNLADDDLDIHGPASMGLFLILRSVRNALQFEMEG